VRANPNSDAAAQASTSSDMSVVFDHRVVFHDGSGVDNHVDAESRRRANETSWQELSRSMQLGSTHHKSTWMADSNGRQAGTGTREQPNAAGIVTDRPDTQQEALDAKGSKFLQQVISPQDGDAV
jgi:hypothetical protein